MTNWTIEDIPDLSGKIAIVTGANSGLGYDTALALARKKATVIMACRNIVKGQDAANYIRMEVPYARLDLIPLDLGNLASVRAFAEMVRAKYDRLDMLINNAGIMMIPRSVTVDGFETQFGVNHLGHFALTGRLLEMLIATPQSRVVTVTSTAHALGRINLMDLQGEESYSRSKAYAQSKLANLLFAFELQGRLSAAKFDTLSLSAHPGYAATNLQHTSSATSHARVESFLYSIANRFVAQSSEMGALPQLYAATSPDVRGGGFYGPRWSTWGHPVERTASSRAYDARMAGLLWQVSEDLTGIMYNFKHQQRHLATTA